MNSEQKLPMAEDKMEQNPASCGMINGSITHLGSKVSSSPSDEAKDRRTVLPTTPRKTPRRLLDYSTPRSRYCGHPQLPLTPDQTPSKGSKRLAEDTFDDLPVCIQPAKRRHTDPENTNARSLFKRGSIFYKPMHPVAQDFSADELKRTCEAVLRQVDWEEVREYVASNRNIVAYRKKIRSVLQSEVTRLFKAEEEGDDFDIMS
ncbi:hypothetical protein MMC13_002658 [Lambiella insularis]|nr:hypothetical protein [Lambiella insularis]